METRNMTKEGNKVNFDVMLTLNSCKQLKFHWRIYGN